MFQPNLTRHHEKSIRANLNPHPQAILSLIKHRTLRGLQCFTICIAAGLCPAPRFSPTRLSPVASDRLFPQLDCFQALGIKRYTLGRRSDRACRADRDLRAVPWLGGTCTLHGELMVVGGLMFGGPALRAWWR